MARRLRRSQVAEDMLGALATGHFELNDRQAISGYTTLAAVYQLAIAHWFFLHV
jgi:hypothetical protein